MRECVRERQRGKCENIFGISIMGGGERRERERDGDGKGRKQLNRDCHRFLGGLKSTGTQINHKEIRGFYEAWGLLFT